MEKESGVLDLTMKPWYCSERNLIQSQDTWLDQECIEDSTQ